MMRHSRLLGATLLSALALLTSCGGGEPTAPEPVVTPTTVTIANSSIVLTSIGDTVTLGVIVRDQNSVIIPSPALVFTSDAPTVAEVTPSGLVTARSNGVATIAVQSGDASAEAAVAVSIASVGSNVTVFPPRIPTDDGNNTVVYLSAGPATSPEGDSLTFSWSSPTATFLGGTSSRFTRATFPGAPASVTVAIDDGSGEPVERRLDLTTAPELPAAGAYDIELVNVSAPPLNVRLALEAAVSTWEGVIRNELTNISFAGSPVAEDTCFEGQPQIDDVVDDIRIYVDIDSIDGPGSTLGRAGPCFSRNSDGTIILGFMQFDSQDLENLSSTVLDAVILHEMAHVFGVGTLWQSRGLLEQPSCLGGCTDVSPSPDTRYTGQRGVLAWLGLGGLATDGGAPVENGEGNGAGQGTRDGHWREIAFDTELMTGFVESTANPLSVLTLASLEDVGLDLLDYSQTDDYVVPAISAAPPFGSRAASVGGHAVHLGDDVYRGPVWVVDDEGNVVRVLEPSR